MSTFFQSRWWRIAKRIALISGIAILAIFITSALVLSLRKEKIVQELIAFVNHQQSGEFELGYTDISWFRYFPNVALEVNNLRYFEHPRAIRTTLEKPIIEARQVYISFNLWVLIRKSEIEVVNLGVQNASLQLVEDSTGVLNIKKALKGKGEKGSQSVVLNLNSIALDSVMMTWQRHQAKKPFALLINEMEAQLEVKDNLLTARLQSTQQIQGVKLFGRYLEQVGETNSDFDLTYDEVQKVLTIHSGAIQYKELTVALAGSYNHLQNRTVDFTFESSSNDLVILKALIREDILTMNKNLLQRSSIDLNGRVYGQLTEGNPQVDVSIHTKGLNVIVPNNRGEFRNIGFEGSFRSGKPDDFSDAEIAIQHITGKIPGGSVSGNLRIRNFKKPTISYHLNASALLDGYDRIFTFNNIANIKGRVSIGSDFEGQLDLTDPNPAGNPVNATIQLEKIGFTLLNTNKRVSDVNGKVILANREVSIQDLMVQLDSSKLIFNGKFNHPYQLIFNHEQNIEVFLNLKSDRLFLRDLVMDTLSNLNEKATGVEIDAVVTSTTSRIRSAAGVDFQIKKLVADFDRMPDLSMVTASGALSTDSVGLNLKVNEIYCQLPGSTVKMQGAVRLNNQKLDLTTSLSVTKLPIQYIHDVLDEFQPQRERDPAVNRTITTEFDFSASLSLHPFSISACEINNGKVRLCVNDSTCFDGDDIALHLENLDFKRLPDTDTITGIKSIIARLTIPSIKLPGMDMASLQVSIRANEESGSWLSLDDVSLDYKLPHGFIAIHGNLDIPSLDSLNTSAKIDIESLSVAEIQPLLTLFKSSVQSDEQSSVKVNSASLNISASCGTTPFTINKLDVQKSRLDMQLTDSLKLSTEVSATLDNVFFENTDGKTTRVESFSGTVQLDQIDLPVFGTSSLSFDLNGQQDNVTVAVTSNVVHAAREQGTIKLDFSKKPVEYQVNYSMEKIPMSYVSKIFHSKEVLSGPLNLDVALQGTGFNKNALTTMKGSFYAEGSNLVLHGIELDRFLKNYKKSQNFDLVDVGAFIVAGPAGPLVTKGTDFFKLLTTDVKESDETKIIQLVTQVDFENNILTSRDVAFTTSENRIALKGQFNYLNNSIPGVTIAVVDKNGCSLLDQRFYGNVKKIQHDKLKVAGTLTGSVTNLANAVVDVNCKVFYAGKVKHPK